MSAYEELKAWCEKHLKPDEYIAEIDNGEGLPYIDIYNHPDYQEITLWFKPNGEFDVIEARQYA